MTDQQIKQGKTPAIIAFFTIFGTIIAIFMNLDPKNRFARFHIKQALGIHLFFLLFSPVVSYADNVFIFGLLYMVYFLLWIYAFLAVLKNQYKTIPYIGKYFQKWFKFIN